MAKRYTDYTHKDCASSMKSDDVHGAVHGPWLVLDDDGRVKRAPDRQTFAYVTGCCCYCRGDLDDTEYRRVERRYEATHA